MKRAYSQTTPSQHILIVGTGAMACLFAARLAAVGVKVTMLGSWQEGLTALAEHGVRLVELDGRETNYPVQVSCQADESGLARFALVLVKSWQTAQAAHQLTECLSQDGLALTLQNGLGNREVLSEILGRERVALGVTTVGASLLAPGIVRAAGNGKIALNGHPRLEPLVENLQSAGFTLERVASPDALLWGKLVVNSAINPLSALLNVTNGELLGRSAARQILHAAAEETAAVARAQEIKLPFADPTIAVEAVARQTAANRSSMLQDVERGAPTEIDAICGAVVAAGERLGLPTPINWMFWQLIRALVNRDESTAFFTPVESTGILNLAQSQ
jgi:2-dehydropantoate 2-reductase